ncbi:MAG: hypothetical protein IIX27_06330 [Ruminococcus sp.]|nr:hypothetical protein [Ruminococcus sp.]
MSEIKDKLELELNEYEFQTDIENIKKIESHRKKKRRNMTIILSSLGLVFAVVLSVVFAKSLSLNVTKKDSLMTNNTTNSHSFFIVASALDSETGKPMEATVDDAGLIDKDIIMIQSCLAYTYYVNGNEKYNGGYDPDDERLEEIFAQEGLTVKKHFAVMGDESMWVEGEDIIKVEYEAQNGYFFKWTDSLESKRIVLNDKEVYSTERVVLWSSSEEFLAWVEEQNAHNGPVDFSTAPKDEISIKVTFSDMSVATRKLKLYYNDYGYLVVETEDGTKYNDGKHNEYENWYKKVYEYDENGNPIIWDYSGRRIE